jgi:hypothetical protein
MARTRRSSATPPTRSKKLIRDVATALVGGMSSSERHCAVRLMRCRSSTGAQLAKTLLAENLCGMRWRERADHSVAQAAPLTYRA